MVTRNPNQEVHQRTVDTRERPTDEDLLQCMDLTEEMLDEIYEAAAPRVELPCQIGPYRLHKEIGRGSCGRVYQAIDTTLQHPVAVKLLAGYADDLVEARKAVAVEHENVVRVFAAGRFEGKSYIVYEFIDGPRLDQHLATRGRRARWRAVRDVARGVAAAHEVGIVHGDIRARNVLMKGGCAKIADFGLEVWEHVDRGVDVADLARLAGIRRPRWATAASLARGLHWRLMWPWFGGAGALAMLLIGLSAWIIAITLTAGADARIAKAEQNAVAATQQAAGMEATIAEASEIAGAASKLAHGFSAELKQFIRDRDSGRLSPEDYERQSKEFLARSDEIRSEVGGKLQHIFGALQRQLVAQGKDPAQLEAQARTLDELLEAADERKPDESVTEPDATEGDDGPP